VHSLDLDWMEGRKAGRQENRLYLSSTSDFNELCTSIATYNMLGGYYLIKSKWYDMIYDQLSYHCIVYMHTFVPIAHSY
jgi:hypothetical protein